MKRLALVFILVLAAWAAIRGEMCNSPVVGSDYRILAVLPLDGQIITDWQLIGQRGPVRRLCVYDRQRYGERLICRLTSAAWFDGRPWLCRNAANSW